MACEEHDDASDGCKRCDGEGEAPICGEAEPDPPTVRRRFGCRAEPTIGVTVAVPARPAGYCLVITALSMSSSAASRNPEVNVVR